MPAKISRRRFLAVTGVTVGAAALTCGGLGMRQPSIDFAETTFGEAAMTNKILVAYASKAGSTGGVAEAIGQTLADSNTEVEVRLMKDVTALTSYRAVVAGSAIRGGEWLEEAMQFVQTHQSTLAQKPFAAFLVCTTLAYSATKASRQKVAAYLEPVRALVKPASEGLFAGVLDYSKLPLIDGLILRAMGDRPGDYRDWNAIRAWAESLKPILAV